MVQSCAVGKIEANLWLLWEGSRLPFTTLNSFASDLSRFLIAQELKTSSRSITV